MKGEIIMNNAKKEALKQFIQELISNKYTRERIQELTDIDVEEEEKTIEPFAFIDPIDPINPVEPLFDFKTFNDVMAETDITLKEEEIEYEPTDEELEYYKKLTEDLKPVDGLCIPCVVDGEDRVLYDGLNCNIKPVPILGINLVTPVNLKVLKVTLTSDMNSEEEIEVEFALVSEENMILFKQTLGELAHIGVIAVVDENEFELNLSPTGFRGITKSVDASELL
jgi:hypothetical protein